MTIGHDGLLLVCGVGGASSHYQIACHVHYLFIWCTLNLNPPWCWIEITDVVKSGLKADGIFEADGDTAGFKA
ncbi:MAG: hypothetical protein KJP06_08845, partial [Deltaproteobacteria bacterium]|nr:hypothetical protein [Deltaproteobacteria bacterium]